MNLLRNNYVTVTFLTILLMLFTSCFSSKKSTIAKKLSIAKGIAKEDASRIDNMLKKKDAKFVEEKIDSNINLNISNKLDSYKNELDSLNATMSFIDSVTISTELYRKNKAEIKAKLKHIQNYISKSTLRLRRFHMIDEGLDIAEQNLFQLAAFFGGGKYEIPSERITDAKKSFSGILDSVASFYNKYGDLDKKATIVILGYADGMGFNKDGETYKSLITLLNNPNASKEEVNKKLSELRANSIADLLEVMFAERIPKYTVIQNVDFEYLQQGRGEEYPSKKITNYTVDDERRKVVLLFWSILPK